MTPRVDLYRGGEKLEGSRSPWRRPVAPSAWDRRRWRQYRGPSDVQECKLAGGDRVGHDIVDPGVRSLASAHANSHDTGSCQRRSTSGRAQRLDRAIRVRAYVENMTLSQHQTDIAREAGIALDRSVVVPPRVGEGQSARSCDHSVGMVGWELQREAARRAVACVAGGAR